MVVRTKIRNTLIRIENGEDPIGTEIPTIGSKTKNEEDPIGSKISMIGSKTKTKLPIENLCSIEIFALTEITKSMNIGQF